MAGRRRRPRVGRMECMGLVGEDKASSEVLEKMVEVGVSEVELLKDVYQSFAFFAFG